MQRTDGYVSGPAGVLDISGDQFVGAGQWQVVKGELYMTFAGDPIPRLVPTAAYRAADGRVILAGSQGEFGQCR
jgi:hypothetical protein